MRVFLHTRKPTSEADWYNTSEQFEQIPRVGEYIARNSSSPWFRVNLVVWLPESAETDYQVEVFAVEVNQLEVYKRVREETDAEIVGGRH